MSQKQIFDKIEAERKKQVSKGYTLAQDITDGLELSMAAAAYAIPSQYRSAGGKPPAQWPWPNDSWKPGTEEEDLVRAAALIVARLEVLAATSKEEDFKDRVQKNQSLNEVIKSPMRRVEDFTPGKKVCSNIGTLFTIVSCKSNVVVENEKGWFVTFHKKELFEVPVAWIGNDALYEGMRIVSGDFGVHEIVWNSTLETYELRWGGCYASTFTAGTVFDPINWSIHE